MWGTEGYSDAYEVGSKRPRVVDSTNPYFAVGAASAGFLLPYGGGYGGGDINYGAALGGYGASAGSSSMYSFPVVRLRGLPFNCTDIDIFKFFSGLDVLDCLLTNKNGRFSGEAFVVFASPMQAEFALERDQQNMGRRYVEVFRCRKQDYYHAVAAEVNSLGIGGGSGGAGGEGDYSRGGPSSSARAHEGKDQMEYTEVLKLRGLPFSVTKADIVNFFGGDFGLAEDNVHVVVRADGRATGEAFVEFASAEEAKRAMGKDRMTIGPRYVELFPSTPEEARRAEARSRP